MIFETPAPVLQALLYNNQLLMEKYMVILYTK